jgi:hypothetical protein
MKSGRRSTTAAELGTFETHVEQECSAPAVHLPSCDAVTSSSQFTSLIPEILVLSQQNFSLIPEILVLSQKF